MSECTHDCSTCTADCGQRQPESMLAPANALSSVQKVIGVVSGKGGVGKSLVAGLLAAELARRGKHTAILDADVTGPSIPRIFGLENKVMGSEAGMLPARSKGGVDVMSVNLLLEHDTDPVVWRGPVVANVIRQFWSEVIWKDVDYMFVDMPPGTGDVALTVFQSLPVDGIVIVTSPQELVSMIVAKAVHMAEMMKIPVLGVVENLSYYECPDCHSRHSIFGVSNLENIAAGYGVKTIARMPLDPKLTKLCDAGQIEAYRTDALAPIIGALA